MPSKNLSERYIKTLSLIKAFLAFMIIIYSGYFFYYLLVLTNVREKLTQLGLGESIDNMMYHFIFSYLFSFFLTLATITIIDLLFDLNKKIDLHSYVISRIENNKSDE